MSFASVEFLVLFAGFLALFLVVRSHLGRRLLLLAVSCIFYAWADWRFLGLLIGITVIDYSIARALDRSTDERRRKLFLVASVVINLGFLFVFKYFGFFLSNMDRIAGLFGKNVPILEVALPIGISFYTFETLSYVVDVYRRVTPPAASLLDYAVFITFFPRLVAGPIMRARQFLPQLEQKLGLSFENFILGLQMVAMGALKKLVVADSIAIFVDRVYMSPQQFTPLTAWAAMFSYSIQIYCDFSGYTDMAMGIARMLGITLPPNFALPYTAQSITEFWQRWHISLSTWLRDYLYIPLGGSRRGPGRTAVNLMLTMLLGGLWHGAKWNFVFWGGLHGLYLAAERLLFRGRPEPAPWTSFTAWIRAAACFFVVSGTWVFFRSPSLGTTYRMGRKLLFLDPGGMFWLFWPAPALALLIFGAGLLPTRLRVALPPYALSNPLVPAFLVFAVLALLVFMPLQTSPFIYFRF